MVVSHTEESIVERSGGCVMEDGRCGGVGEHGAAVSGGSGVTGDK